MDEPESLGAISLGGRERLDNLKISGAHLHRCWLNVPSVTHHDEADVTELESYRKSIREHAEKEGVRVTALVFVLKALSETVAFAAAAFGGTITDLYIPKRRK